MPDILRKALDSILDNDKNNPGQVFADLKELHDFFAEITGISAHDVSGDDYVWLSTGKAIAPGQAAHCLVEANRTAAFVRGIHKALQKLKGLFPQQRLNILYAGCGPYASLLTPLTLLYDPGEVTFTMLDINKTSIAAAKKLYEHLDIEQYVTSWVLADAATYKAGNNYHLIISETMQQALKREPQVSIMQNLIPQLSVQGIFIPERIDISAQLINQAKENASFLVAGMKPERIHLGNIYTIGSKQWTGQQPVTIQIPGEAADFPRLSLMTDIIVFEDELLTRYDCSLNLPLKVIDADRFIGKNISFRYEMGHDPRFKYELS